MYKGIAIAIWGSGITEVTRLHNGVDVRLIWFGVIITFPVLYHRNVFV